MPPLGLGMASHGGTLTSREVELLRAVRPTTCALTFARATRPRRWRWRGRAMTVPRSAAHSSWRSSWATAPRPTWRGWPLLRDGLSVARVLAFHAENRSGAHERRALVELARGRWGRSSARASSPAARTSISPS